MGRSLDWLDIYRDHGPEAVRAALEAAQPHPHPHPHDHHPHDAARTPHAPHEPPHDDRREDDQAARDGRAAPPAHLVLPAQAGPRARLVLDELFRPQQAAGSAWELRRFAGQWWIYVPARIGLPRWRPADDEEVRGAVRERLERFYTRREAKGGIPDEKGREWKYAPFAPTDRVVEDILKATAHYLAVRAESVPAWLPPDFGEDGEETPDQSRWRRDHVETGPVEPDKIIAFRNGLLDVAAWTGEGGGEGTLRMLPHTPRWFSAVTLDTDLPAEVLRAELAGDEEAVAAALADACPAWLDFVADISGGSEAKIESLQRFVAYAMTGDVSLDKMLWVQGPPGSGKSTLVEGIEAALGHQNVAHTDLDALSGRFGVAPLVGKTAAIISEMHVGRMTDAAAALQRLKAISGGNPQQVEDKFLRSRARVNMTVKFIITPNEEPRLPDASSAITRRLVVIPVSQVVSRPDPTLSKRLEAERGGIRAWAILGLRRLWRDVREGREAFPMPEDGRELLLEIEAAASPIKAFIREECVVGPGNSCTTDVLYEACARWRAAEGMSEHYSRQTFGTQLRAACPGARREERVLDGKRVKIYTGIRPRVVADEDQDGLRIHNVRRSSFYLDTDGWNLTHDEPVAPRTPRTE